VWENNYLLLLKYRKGTVDVVAGKFKFFFKNTKQVKVCNQNIHLFQAFRIYLMPADNASNPILSLKKKVENLQKVKLIEHVYLITQFMGLIE
jgi:hypothetical protein